MKRFTPWTLGDFDHHPGGRIIDFEGIPFVLFTGGVADDGCEVDDAVSAGHSLDNILYVAAVSVDKLEIRVVEDRSNGGVAVDETV